MNSQRTEEYNGLTICGFAVLTGNGWRSILSIEQHYDLPLALTVLPMCESAASAIEQALSKARRIIDAENRVLSRFQVGLPIDQVEPLLAPRSKPSDSRDPDAVGGSLVEEPT